MDHRIFNIDEAQITLEEVIKPTLNRIYGNLKKLARVEKEGQILELIVHSGANESNPDRASFERLSHRATAIQSEMQEDVEAIKSTGAVIKDLRHGLVDFFTIIDDRLVFLCWQRGEDRIRFWHTIEEGFQGRRPLGERASELDD